MKFAVLGNISLGVWIFVLSGPLDCVAHGFHDGYAYDGLYIEGIFGNSSSVPLNGCTLVSLCGWPVKWTTIVICKPATWNG